MSSDADKSVTGTDESASNKSVLAAPTISLPKGGGAIRGIGEKFGANPVTGTGSMTVPIATSPGRSGFGPQLSLSYDSGSGNGPFGFGWSLSLPAITRKSDKGLPRYFDLEESDVFILSGAEDLVPVFVQSGGEWIPEKLPPRAIDGEEYQIRRYRPRIEGLFARIERWTNSRTGEIHWRSISKDNITTLYGKDNDSRIFDPNDPAQDHPTRIFSWLICQSYDDKGNAIIYEYVAENSKRIFEDHQGQPIALAHERNRDDTSRSANRYLKRIKYGNRIPNRDRNDWQATDPVLLPPETWMFEVVLDYGEGHYDDVPLDPSKSAEEQHRFVTARADAPPDTWPCRHDPFSSYRAGIEVRTYRLCRRILMFHHFQQELGSVDYLVRSTNFDYAESPIASFITGITQSGYVRPETGHPERYLKKSLPPLVFQYTEAKVHDEIHEVDSESLENLPYGFDGSHYQWVDLDGEGISGVLTEQAGAWFYKRNLSPNPLKDNGRERDAARFAPVELVTPQPAFALAGGAQLMDLAGDGQPDLVQFDGSVRGFYERTGESDWEPFRPFVSWPNVDTRDPNLKFVDLNGDGHSDIMITENDVLTWYPSLGEDGFGPAQRVLTPFDEEEGPRLLFADGTQAIYLADMSGDGLTDLVRIRNGDVCYWPNLGYGRFGAKVTMDNSPWFDAPDQFDQKRIRIADIDGSGNTDIIYLDGQGARLYFNQSGNAWSDPQTLTQFPPIDNISSVTVVDLLGNGTACLVWSSPLPGNGGAPMRYVDLMGGQKPHLLVSVANNLGAETKVQYAPSTKFYVADRFAGKPWITKLPFPVHVVERVETYDYISRNRFVTRYTYHHGYFDGEEREFRGFGRVDQLDTEEFAALSQSNDFPTSDNIDAASHVPPVLTKTWFHTGAYLEEGRISRHLEDEYYREGDESASDRGLSNDQLEAMLLPDTMLPSTIKLQDATSMPRALSSDELREACRALKGSILRQEIYGLDGTDAQDRPYSASERNYTIECLQPHGDNQHAVLFAHPRETVDFHYERTLYKVSGGTIVDPSAAPPPNVALAADPRVTHAVTLEVDGFGNVLKSVAIGYGRRLDDFDRILTAADKQKQKQTMLTYTENEYTNPILLNDTYRATLPSETRTYELTNISPDAKQPQLTYLFRFEELQTKTATFDKDHDLPYEDLRESGAVISDALPYRRLIECSRTLYCKDDLSGALAAGTLESMALPYETYKLAFTPGLLSRVYRRRQSNGTFEDLLPDIPGVLATDGGYIDLDVNGCWWIPSGKVFYSPQITDAPAQELAHARRHFFLPCRFQDPFGQTTTIAYDTNDADPSKNNDLFIVESRDPVGNTVRVQNDYRVLQPELVIDPNVNRSAVVFDALGMVVGTAVMGKEQEPHGEPKGDLLDGFVTDLSQQKIDTFFDALDPHVPAPSLLKGATTRIIYDLDRFVRTRRAYPEDPTHWLPVYGATLARETHVSDPLPSQGLEIEITLSYSDGLGREIQKKIQAEPGPLAEGAADASPRWVGTGWTIFNNKGKPVRKYEPSFSATFDFEFAKTVGVSPILFYDPVERVVATLNPNHTYEKVVFAPWRQATSDVNDTVLQADPKNDPDVGDFFRRLPDADYLPTWHAQRQGGALGAQEQAAATKAAVHADTSAVAYFDTLGRTFLTLVHNRFQRNGNTVDERYSTRLNLDIEGNQRAVIDARDRIVMRYDYDMLSNRIHHASMEAGKRWTLNDVAGKPIFSWDSRGHTLRTTYDALRRPTEVHLSEGTGLELLVQRTIYGETQLNPEANNLRTKGYQAFDGAGVVTTDAYDFKGNLLRSSRQLAVEYKNALDWSATVALEGQTYTNFTTYDALNRLVALTTPDNSVIRPSYNEANFLERIEGNLRGSATVTSFVTNIDYDAKGQRSLIQYGNGVRTQYEYDPQTFRLTHLFTARGAAFPGDDPNPPQPPRGVQNIRYTYDPAGNMTHIRDDAQQTIYFRNQRVEPSAEYTYDATYRLIAATGREHLGQVAGGSALPPTPTSDTDAPRVGLLHPSDGNAMGRYLQRCVYDEVGNILEMIHAGTDPANPGWTRAYKYKEVSLLEPLQTSNRLTSTQIGSDPPQPYTHDAHGNITTMPHLRLVEWDFKDQLHMSEQQTVNNAPGERTYYVYDAMGQRVRKVTERQNGTRRKERVYLGNFETYREYNGDGRTVTLERETLHLVDAKQRIALIETRTAGKDPSPAQLVRYQLGNHLGSASLELDAAAQVISYEDYYPYGGTSYQATQGQTAAPKRYRYTAKERDEETGLSYHRARYYAPWLGRWVSSDPIGIDAAIDGYEYASANPTRLRDELGLAPEDAQTKTLHELYGRETALRQKVADLVADIKNFTDRSLEAAQERNTLKQEYKEIANKAYNNPTLHERGFEIERKLKESERAQDYRSRQLQEAPNRAQELGREQKSISEKLAKLPNELSDLRGSGYSRPDLEARLKTVQERISELSTKAESAPRINTVSSPLDPDLIPGESTRVAETGEAPGGSSPRGHLLFILVTFLVGKLTETIERRAHEKQRALNEDEALERRERVGHPEIPQSFEPARPRTILQRLNVVARAREQISSTLSRIFPRGREVDRPREYGITR